MNPATRALSDRRLDLADASGLALGQLDPDTPIWLALVAAFTYPQPPAGFERAGHAAARGLLALRPERGDVGEAEA
jgi:hypothetical protein